MSNARAHFRNLAANWTAHGANLVVMFFLSPFVIHTLGSVEYGIWSLLSVLTGYMGVLDLGVKASTGRHIILYLGRRDHGAVDQTIRTSLGLYSGLGLVVVVVGIGIGWLFPSVFRSVPDEYIRMTQLLLPLLSFNVWFSTIQGVFSSVLVAHDRFDLTRAIDVGVLVMRTTGTIIALSLGWGIGGLGVVIVGCRALGLAGNYMLARRIYRRLRVWPPKLETSRLRELFGYGLGAFVSIVSFRIIGQTDLVIAGAAIDVASVAVYSVGAMLVFYVGSFMGHINETLFPAIQRAVAAGKLGDARWLFLRSGRLKLACGLLIYIGMAVFAEPFIHLWMLGPTFGEESVRQAAMIMQLLAASKLGGLLSGVGVQVLNSMGHVRLTATLAATQAAVNLGLSLLFVLGFGWGLAGIAGGTLAAQLLVGAFPASWFTCAKIGVNWWNYLMRLGGSGLIVGLLFAVACLLIRQLGTADSWGVFCGQVALATGVYIVLATWLLVPSADRLWIWRRLLKRPATAEVSS